MQNKPFLIIISLLFAQAHIISADNGTKRDPLEERIWEALGADETTEESYSKLIGLPPEVVPWLTQKLKTVPKLTPIANRFFWLLGFKLRQFDGILPKQVREQAIDELVAECESVTSFHQTSMLNDLRGLRDDNVLKMATRLSKQSDPDVKKAAFRVLNQKKKGVDLNIKQAKDRVEKESKQ